MSWLSAIPGVGKGIDSFLHPERGYEDAAKEMEKAWQQAQQFAQQGIGYQEPFRQAGLDQLGRLNSAENSLLDPSKLLAQWMGDYTTSPYAQRSIENAKSAGMDAASSMGLSGSNAAVSNIQNSASDIMNADRQTYLNDMMQKYMAGIGIGQNMYGIGASTAGNMGNMMSHMGDQAMNFGQNMGQAAYGARNAPGDMLKNLLAMGAKMYMQSQTGGAVG